MNISASSVVFPQGTQRWETGGEDRFPAEQKVTDLSVTNAK